MWHMKHFWHNWVTSKPVHKKPFVLAKRTGIAECSFTGYTAPQFSTNLQAAQWISKHLPDPNSLATGNSSVHSTVAKWNPAHGAMCKLSHCKMLQDTLCGIFSSLGHMKQWILSFKPRSFLHKEALKIKT